MRGLLIPLILILLFILTFLFGYSSSSNSSGSEPVSDNSLLPITTKRDTAIVAGPDGTIYFVEDGSGKILWSFSSGPSIYSSFQQLPNHEGEKTNVTADFYVDFGEDWKLYLHRAGQKKALSVTAEEFVSRTPFVSASGGIVLGSKKTSVFLVDEDTGKIIDTFRSDDSPPSFWANETSVLTRNIMQDCLPSTPLETESLKKTLYVTRTDYLLKYIYGKTGRVLWYLKFAEIEASYHSEGVGSFFGGFPQMDIDLNKKLPINFQTRPLVYRVLDRGSLEPLITDSKLPGGSALSLPAPRHNPIPHHNPIKETIGDLIRFDHGSEKERMLPLPSLYSEETKAKSVSSLTVLKEESESLKDPHLWPSVVYGAIATVIVAPFLFIRHAISKQRGNMHTYSEGLKLQSATPKKKKNRKAGTNKRPVDNIQDEISKNNAVTASDGIEKSVLNFSFDNDSLVDSRKIGRLTFTNKEIAKGSNGTVVLEGSYDGRPVAVKRLVRTHHDVAVKEIKNLIASDQHPNIVRWYGVEYDRDFVYLSLERCMCSLHELISFYASRSQITKREQDGFPCNIAINFQMLAGSNEEMELWRVNGYPSIGLLKLMRDIVSGVAHLHELGIVHRDLKPQNVLVIKDRSISAKISDMGISKRLDGEMTSLTKNATGYGTSGWQAPEQLRHERQTRAVDLFSLGCILFFCITGGKHPFGESIERDINILSDQKDLFLIDNIPEATDLISRLLDSNPQLRPNAIEALCHPLFWNSEMRLSFLKDMSDRVELEDREKDSELLVSLENCGKLALGGKWDEKMDTAFLKDIGRYRHYKFDSVRDLLRVIRNKLNHFRELSKEIQVILGPVPEGFDCYFLTRFPKLLIEVYRVALKYCAGEDIFWKYFRSDQF